MTDLIKWVFGVSVVFCFLVKRSGYGIVSPQVARLMTFQDLASRLKRKNAREIL